jgi:hypothetical protein
MSTLSSLFKKDPLPAEYGQISSIGTGLSSSADSLRSYGTDLTKLGQSELDLAYQDKLTPSQQSKVDSYQTGLTNQARQMYYNMGRTPDKDTSFISTTADIDSKVSAMSEDYIQSTIKLGLGELAAGASLFSSATSADSAATTALSDTGKAQLDADKDYKKTLTDTFNSLFKLFGTATGTGGIKSLLGGTSTAAATDSTGAALTATEEGTSAAIDDLAAAGLPLSLI